MKLGKREEVALRDIARYTTTPTKDRHGYSKYWTPKTHQKLHEKGLVEYVYDSVCITEAGRAAIAV